MLRLRRQPSSEAKCKTHMSSSGGHRHLGPRAMI